MVVRRITPVLTATTNVLLDVRVSVTCSQKTVLHVRRLLQFLTLLAIACVLQPA